MYCPSCGRFFPGEGSTCELCGAAIPGAPTRAAVPRTDSLSLTFTGLTVCRFCGAQLASEADQCPSCGQTQSAAVQFAGFGRRFVASCLDAIVLTALLFVIGMFVVIGIGFFAAASGDNALLRKIPTGKWQTTVISLLLQVGVVLVAWIYHARMESSPGQATLGKRWLKMRVVDTEGGRLSFGRATKRFFSKILSAIAFGAGFIMIAFSDRKQGLHDRIADTLVVLR